MSLGLVLAVGALGVADGGALGVVDGGALWVADGVGLVAVGFGLACGAGVAGTTGAAAGGSGGGVGSGGSGADVAAGGVGSPATVARGGVSITGVGGTSSAELPLRTMKNAVVIPPMTTKAPTPIKASVAPDVPLRRRGGLGGGNAAAPPYGVPGPAAPEMPAEAYGAPPYGPAAPCANGGAPPGTVPPGGYAPAGP